MTDLRPSVIVLAGANGSGKSSLAPSLLRGQLAVSEFVNADVIAQGLSGFNPESVALAAGRVMLNRLHELGRQRVSFAFETTLASRTFVPWLSGLIATGYDFHLVFLWLPAPELAVARVADRVRGGGHRVPEETVRRRYRVGLKNFFRLYRPRTNSWRFYDNSRTDQIGSSSRQARAWLKTMFRSLRHGSRSKENTEMERKRDVDIAAAFEQGTPIDEALNRGVREAVKRHKQLGLPLVVWRDGKVAWIPPEEITGDGESCRPAKNDASRQVCRDRNLTPACDRGAPRVTSRPRGREGSVANRSYGRGPHP